MSVNYSILGADDQTVWKLRQMDVYLNDTLHKCKVVKETHVYWLLESDDINDCQEIRLYKDQKIKSPPFDVEVYQVYHTEDHNNELIKVAVVHVAN
jgi:hypothetical protein